MVKLIFRKVVSDYILYYMNLTYLFYSTNISDQLKYLFHLVMSIKFFICWAKTVYLFYSFIHLCYITQIQEYIFKKYTFETDPGLPIPFLC